MTEVSPRRKLIEASLPLEAINEASRKEKSPFVKNHPRALHVWWARRPLAACRAVLFASLVDDPSAHPEEFATEEAQDAERQRLFGIIEELVKWENTTNERVLELARAEIMRSTGGNPPPVLDPFCGGGSIPLEAQRLGLETHASDLNPVAVLITKALIEIPPKFTDMPPVNPESRAKFGQSGSWKGAQGLAEDVRYYGEWMRDEAEKRIGHLYPKAELPKELGRGEATVVVWLWARTVTCPNPACGAEMPLVRSFWLSTKKGKKAWIEPVVDRDARHVEFIVKTGDQGTAPPPTKVGRGAKFTCLVCQTTAPEEYIKSQGKAGEFGRRQIARVVALHQGRGFLAPSSDDDDLADPTPNWTPTEDLQHDPRNIWCLNYGLTRIADLFTGRQLSVLSTLGDTIDGAAAAVEEAAIQALGSDASSIELARSYTASIRLLLALSLSRLTDFSNAICSWDSGNTNMRQLFARQAIPMSWDYAETNLLDGIVDIKSATGWAASAIAELGFGGPAEVKQADAAVAEDRPGVMVCTDPPYYDNISYANLSDVFYAFLRHSLRSEFPELLDTLLTPKREETVAAPSRFGGDVAKADAFFEEALGKAFLRMRSEQHPSFPMTLFYAFKQAEASAGAGPVSSTGWEVMLTGLVSSGFEVTGTWPLRTEQQQRSVSIGTNALASSIVLVCRPRPDDAPVATRREFIDALKDELPEALRRLQHGNIAPVDLAQASIGPGMAVFSRYSEVIEASGEPMPVRTALELINQMLAEVVTEHDDELDGSTRFMVTWFEQHGLAEGAFGDADVLARAYDVAVDALERDGIVTARRGKVGLVPWTDLIPGWDPSRDLRPTTWEATHHLIRAHQDPEAGSEQAAADLLRELGEEQGERARDLAYRLYLTCERESWADEALAYNALVVAWPEIKRLAVAERPEQTTIGE